MLINTYRAVLVKETGTRYQHDVCPTRSDQVVRLMNTLFDVEHRAEEHVWMLALDVKSRVNGVFEISSGSINATFLSPNVVVRNAVLANAVAVVLIHNHPSGDTTPGTEDVSSTKRVKEALGIVQIQLLDHIIIGEGKYHSFADSGTL